MAKLKFWQALNQALREEMERDPDVFILGEDVGLYGGTFRVTDGLLEKFGEMRVLDTPIAENSFVGMAIGAAITGLRPIVELMSIDFAPLAMDQITSHAAKMRYMFGGNCKVPIVIRAPEGTGTQKGAQHSNCLEAWFMHVPGMKVVVPSTPGEAKGLLISSIRDDNPVLFIEHEKLYNISGEVPENEFRVPIGKADLKREGKDVTIVSYAYMSHVSLDAAAELQNEGISAEVIDLRTLKPIDTQAILKSVEKTNRVVIVEEDWKTGGVGAEISALIAEESFWNLDAPIIRVAGDDVPIPYSKELEKMAVPNKEKIIRAVHKTLHRD
jgi:pyruvate dehydrogenase E1 component beta subunit